MVRELKRPRLHILVSAEALTVSLANRSPNHVSVNSREIFVWMHASTFQCAEIFRQAAFVIDLSEVRAIDRRHHASAFDNEREVHMIIREECLDLGDHRVGNFDRSTSDEGSWRSLPKTRGSYDVTHAARSTRVSTSSAHPIAEIDCAAMLPNSLRSGSRCPQDAGRSMAAHSIGPPPKPLESTSRLVQSCH